MPSKSKQQQKFMGIVRSIQKGEAPAGKFSKAAQKAAKSMEKGSVRKYATRLSIRNFNLLRSLKSIEQN